RNHAGREGAEVLEDLSELRMNDRRTVRPDSGGSEGQP
ncbi:MAG: hypothetical protein QOI90_3319, partial [Mycobacterium sp.]|nr:hypothetical protein [Mycobacterium sp.]